ncbi:hypothetical protein GCM10011579_040680 [Streptomyces albiflavescens]|uniref:Uncharacterized protein n=1 Tax=Streptomyces albiflavescens TaxID=1623582 RepID=A0A917Y4U5_9ACTN|nr:hypothetical protein [Streptomyces albiflavescens]GGN67835.1 hypothetical protein GCM10011579_040680 [Streptomyces albiflavescens]
MVVLPIEVTDPEAPARHPQATPTGPTPHTPTRGTAPLPRATHAESALLPRPAHAESALLPRSTHAESVSPRLVRAECVSSPRPPRTEPAPRTTSTGPRPAPAERLPSPAPAGRALRRFLPTTLALLLAVPLLAAAHHQARTAPYGDHVTVHARVDGGDRPSLRTTGATVEAYDEGTGRPRWTYTREGRRPMAVVPARGDAIALWDDGLVTATVRGDGSAVRWHRALPGAAPWLAAHRGGGVLRILGPRMLAVVTPQRVAAYRIADGDLRWVLPARQGCAFEPARAVRVRTALLIAQPCAATDSWTGEIVAVDELGRITADRTPLDNERRGEHHSVEHPHTEKVVARPR